MADKTFGDNLSKSRKKAGLSQEELAEKMGLAGCGGITAAVRGPVGQCGGADLWGSGPEAQTGAPGLISVLFLWLPGGDVYYGRLCPHGESNQHRDIPYKHYNRSTGDDAGPGGGVFLYRPVSLVSQEKAQGELTGYLSLPRLDKGRENCYDNGNFIAH